MPPQHQLTMRSGPTPGATFVLEGDQISIGRDAVNDIVINDAEVNRRHARLTFQGGKYVIEDLGSTNGTFVNGQRLAGPRVLKPGEVVSIGEQIVCVYETYGGVPAFVEGMSGKSIRKLRVFLCHASQDKSVVRELYQRLINEHWIDPWLDEERLYPGQDWHFEIEKAVSNADAVIVCLSNGSVNKEGYIQRELRFVLNVADEKPEGSIFVIPLRLNDCIMPTRLKVWQYLDYFPKERKEWAYKRLIDALRIRLNSIKQL